MKAFVVKVKDSNHDAASIKERDKLLNVQCTEVSEFKNADCSTLEKIVGKDGGINPDFCIRPSIKQFAFIEWMKKHNTFKASGFVTSQFREDCGTYIDSIEGTLPKSSMDIEAFKQAFSSADGISISFDNQNAVLYAWYD
jgi:hypothetical protein